MVANRRTLTWLSWALVVLVVISAAVLLLFVTGVLLPDPDETADFVDQVLFMHQGGRMPHDWNCESLGLFAREVMPEFAETAALQGRRTANLAKAAP